MRREQDSEETRQERSGLAQIRFDQRKRADSIKQIEDKKSSNEIAQRNKRASMRL
jgi:hypothetical protein